MDRSIRGSTSPLPNTSSSPYFSLGAYYRLVHRHRTSSASDARALSNIRKNHRAVHRVPREKARLLTIKDATKRSKPSAHRSPRCSLLYDIPFVYRYKREQDVHLLCTKFRANLASYAHMKSLCFRCARCKRSLIFSRGPRTREKKSDGGRDE